MWLRLFLRPQLILPLDLLDIAALHHLGQDTLIEQLLDVEIFYLRIAQSDDLLGGLQTLWV